MRKSIRIIAGAAFVLAAASCEKTLDEPINESAQETRALTKSGDNNWITQLPDNAYASQLSIPGTHDAATGDGTVFSLGKTQSLSLQEQWDMGIRAFDLRPGYKKVRKGLFKYENELHIYHGIVETKTSFRKAVQVLSDNLAANPGEFAIIIMRFENDSPLYNKRDVWNSLMSSFLTSSDFPA